jgi:hypothetical protein
MNQQPDKLFRDKLQNYQPAAPASAWDRIAAAQGKKKSNKGWLKIAASLLLVASAGSVWMLTRPGTQENQAVNTATVAPEGLQHSKPKGTSIDPAAIPDVTEESTTEKASDNNLASTHVTDTKLHPTVPEANDNGESSKRTNVIAQKMSVAVQKTNVVVPQEQLKASVSDSEDNNGIDIRTTTKITEDNNQIVTAHAAVASQSVTLTYSADDVSSYLNKNTGDEATEDERKQSTLKKLLQKANDLKTNQDPFGELRQRKNEILALNFMNDKRGQKTRN